MYSVAQNCVIEIPFYSSARNADPYNDVELDVEIRRPDGSVTRVPAFWSGDNVWRFRFAGDDVGLHKFQTICSNSSDTGLHQQGGDVSVSFYEGGNRLYRHGRLRVADDKRHFVQADGTPFFWLGDTWWMGLCSRLDWPQGVRTLAADRVAKGFNVAQIIAGPYPDMDAWDPRGKNEAGYPFTKGFQSINPAYYDHADLKIGYLVSVGLMPCIVGMWGYYLPEIGVEKIKRFWRFLVARYGAFPVVWCIAGEGTMSYYLSKTPKEDSAAQKKGWTEVMAYVRQIDGYHNLVCIHPTQYGREQVEDPSLMDFDMLQTGHGDLESVPNVAESVIKSVGREPRMPVVNGEINYEGILGRCWQNVQRICFYTTVLNGAAGHTYGGNGIWQMSTEEQPYGASPHGRGWGNTPWQEAYQLPGSRQVGVGAAFMRRFPWWTLERHPEWVEPAWQAKDPYARTTAGIPGKLRIVYSPSLWDPPLVKDIEASITYEASYIDPTNGGLISLGVVTPDSEGKWRPPCPPVVHDWLLVMEAKA
ncbi:MAG: DUF4038 domain-containing protein [Candidatus Hydrogenedentes bacterium]|nr:DUF4038 domain-containing protein [Candidatus Hydrogenedentota bacterium]